MKVSNHQKCNILYFTYFQLTLTALIYQLHPTIGFAWKGKLVMEAIFISMNKMKFLPSAQSSPSVLSLSYVTERVLVWLLVTNQNVC